MTIMCGTLHHTKIAGLPVKTPRLTLIPATAGLVKAESQGAAALAKSLGAKVPANWPPKYVPDSKSQDRAAWWNWYFVRRATGKDEALVVGFGAIKGWPSTTGTVQMGCALFDEHQANGYGPEAFAAMAEWALSQSVDRVITDVPADHAPSLKVLAKIGFLKAGAVSGGTLARYERLRVPVKQDANALLPA